MRQFGSSRPRSERYNKDGAYETMIRSGVDKSILHRKPYHMTCGKKKGNNNEK